MNNTSSSQDSEFMYEVLPAAIILIVENIIGAFGNLSIVWATFRNSKLQTTCNWLIALNAIADGGTQLAQYVLTYYLFIGINQTNLWTCWHLQFIPYMFFSSTMIITILVGIDRLITILFPHISYNKALYLIGLAVIPACYSTMWAIISYHPMTLVSDMKVVCTLDQFVTGHLRTPKNYINIFLSVLMLTVYASIWLFLRLKKVGSTFTRRVIKALTIIMLIEVLTWPVSMGIFTISQRILPPTKFVVVGIYLATLLNFGMCSDYFVYYAFSTEYRTAFKKQFPLSSCYKKETTKTHFSTVTHLRGSRSTIR